jgi:DNA transformation protein and related proteins
MGSRKETIDYILSQLDSLEGLRHTKMFGEYGVYQADKLFALVCDDQFFLKPTTAGRDFLVEAEEGYPYPGSKPWLYIPEDKWEDADWLVELVRISLPEISPIKKKTKKTK